MSAIYSVLPMTAAASQRGLTSVMALAVNLLKRLARAVRHRREAAVLAALDRRMLADIGITRSDVQDAFSEPLWEDPTALLRERALERRWNRTLMRSELADQTEVEAGFRRPPTDRPARQAV